MIGTGSVTEGKGGVRSNPPVAMGMLDRFRLDGKVALVTGGGKGIGRGIALALAECGADLAVLARRSGDVEAVADEIRERGRRALAISGDVLEDSGRTRTTGRQEPQ